MVDATHACSSVGVAQNQEACKLGNIGLENSLVNRIGSATPMLSAGSMQAAGIRAS